MTDKLVCSIALSWPPSGRVSHKFLEKNVATGQERNLLPLASAFLLTSQLGRIQPSMALTACSRALSLCELDEDTTWPICSAVRSASIDLVQRPDGIVYHTFSPVVAPGSERSAVDWAVEQLVTNFADYSSRNSPPPLAVRLKSIILVCTFEFLQVLQQDVAMKLTGFQGSRTPKRLTKHMNQFVEVNVYRLWTSVAFDEAKVSALIPENRQLHRALCAELEISDGWHQLA